MQLSVPPRRLQVALVAAAIALVATATAVRGEYPVGPGTIQIGLRPQFGGSTVVLLPPFGTVEAATHKAPTAIVLSPRSINALSAQELVESRPNTAELVESLRADLEDAFRSYALRLTLAGLVAGALAAAFLRCRRPGEWAAGICAGVLVPVGLYAATFAGYDADAFRQPTLTGALSRSPELLGPVNQFGERFAALRNELEEIGSITFRLYQFLARQSPIPQDAIRILLIADLHLNPVGYDVALEVARRFRVDAVIDAGDVTAEGTPLETGFVDRVSRFTVPYIFIRGNHDSSITQAAVAAQPNARVLDGDTTEIEGLRIFGIGDPLFTPDKTVEQPTTQEQREAKLHFASVVRIRVLNLEEAPDIVAVHDPLIADRLAGRVPLVVHGHLHRWSVREEEGTHFLGVASTGAAGLRSIGPDSDVPIGAMVLYFDRSTRTLLGYDQIEVMGPQQQFLLDRTIVNAGEERTPNGSTDFENDPDPQVEPLSPEQPATPATVTPVDSPPP